MKRYFVFLCCTLLGYCLMAQTTLASYSFTYSEFVYNEITEGLVLGNSSTDNQNFISETQQLGSSETSGSGFPIGFSFFLSGYRFDRIGVSANGWISLGQSELGDAAVNMRTTSSYSPISSVISHTVPFTVSRVAGLAGDLQAQTGAEIRVFSFGNAPFRECVIQWKNYKKKGTMGTGDSFNFQIKLQEGTNNVSIQYGIMTTGQEQGLFDVGLRSAPATSNTNWMNRVVDYNWAESTAGTSATDKCMLAVNTYPNPGATYTFIAPTINAIPTASQLISPANNAQNVSNPAKLSWMDNGGWTSGYRLYLGTDNPPTNIHNGTDIGYVYSDTLLLQYSTQYYWRIAPYNSIGANNSSPIRSFTTVAPPLSGFIFVGGLGAHYQNLSLAITDLNVRGVGDGGLIVYLNEDTITGNFPTITATGYEDRPIVFKPAPGFSPVLNPTGGSGSACFKLVGSDYVSFEGLSINGGSIQYGIWVVGSLADQAKNISISGCTFNMPYYLTQNFGIIIDGVTDSLRIVDNVISGPFNGVYISGGSNSYLQTQNALVSGNLISGSRNNGIYAFNASVEIIGNTISLNSVSSSDMYGIYCGWSGGIYNVSQNIIQNGSTSRYFYGLFGQSDNAVFTSNTVQNCTSTEYAMYGAYLTGMCQVSNNVFTGLTATNNSQLFGIFLYSGTHIVHGNEIKNISSTGDIFGIYARAHNHTISANRILGLYHTGSYSSQVCGIAVQSGTTNNIHNNMIGDLTNPNSYENLTISGIQIVSGVNHIIYHNTVLIDPDTSTGYHNSNSAALYLAGGASYDIRNNIFINKTYTGGGKSVAIWKTTAGFNEISVHSDANVYYVNPNQTGNYIACFGINNYNTLELYQLNSGSREQNSFTEDVPFTSSSSPFNLKINSMLPTVVESNALPIANFTYDFEGDLRNSSSPDIGADEGDFTPLFSGLENPVVSIVSENAQIVLRWTAVPNAIFYKVYYSSTPDNWDSNLYYEAFTTEYTPADGIYGFFRVTACR